MIKIIFQIKPGSKATAGLGLGVSRFADQGEHLNDEDKSIFDFCKDGNLVKLTELLNNSNINITDEDVKIFLVIWLMMYLKL